MKSYGGRYSERFAQAFLVDAGEEIIAWTERNPVMANDNWQVDAYTDTTESNGECFILAVPMAAGMVGFFAATKEDADRIREAIS